MKHRKKNIGSKILVFVLSFAMSFNTLLAVLPEYIVNAAEKVARVTVNTTTTDYGNIKDAWEAVKKSGGTIDILQDWDTQSYGRLIVNDNTRVTINLNGHIINRHLASTKSSKSKKDGETLFVGKGASVTINGGDQSVIHGGYIDGEDNIWYEKSDASGQQMKGGVIAGGYSTNGAGGIHIKEGANVKLNDVTIAGNKADEYYGDGYGGGIAAYGKGVTLTLNNSKVIYNYAETSGGGIAINKEAGNISLENGSEISHNTADDKYGGGVYFDDDDQKIRLGDKCKISYNKAKYGGGIYSDGNTIYVKLADSAEISSNSVSKDGGAAYFNYSTIVVKGGTIKDNTAAGGGGGIWLQHYSSQYSDDSVTLANTTYTGNRANDGCGGAIHTEQEHTNVSGCTIKNNYASKNGGGVYIYNDYCSVNSSTVTNNKSDGNGGGVYVKGLEDVGLSGKVIITDNTAQNKQNNLALATSGAYKAYLTSSAGAGSKIGIWIKSDDEQKLSADEGHYVESIYFSDKEGHYVEWGNDRFLRMKKGEKSRTPSENKDASVVESTGDTIKGYFSYPSMEDSEKDLSGVFYYSDKYFSDPKTYNEQLATMSMCLAMSAFNSSVGNNEKGGTDYTLKAKNVVKLMTDIGVKKDNVYLSDTYTVKPGTRTIGVAIGQKELKNNDGTILVPIAVRGSGYESEWASNVTIGNGKSNKEHEGFADAADQVFAQVKSYIEKYGLTDAVKSGKIKFWVTGYSRAGATSNLVAKRLIDAYADDKNEVYAYCMEAPQGAYSSDKTNVNPNGKYDSIHNCINFNDPVPKVAPIGMNFVRYGVDHVFNPGDSKDNVSKVKKQLAMISSETAFDDYYHLATLKLVLPKVSYVFCVDSDMLQKTGGSKNAPKNAGEYTDGLLANLQDWAINNREDFVSAPKVDLRTDTSLEQVSFEKSLQLVMPIMFAKSSEELDKLTEIASQRTNDLDTTGIYKNILGENWDRKDPGTKKKWIWEKLWNVLVEPSDGEGMASVLTKQELINLKTAWPTLIDRLLAFADKDYQFKDWASGTASNKGLNVIATLMYNSSALLQTHYPEINYAWLRTEDSNYNNETSEIKVTSNLTPSVNYSLKEGSYNGMQVLKLDTKESDKDNGAAIFYQLTTEVNGKTTTSSWMPYNKQIVLPTGVDSDGNQTTAKYTVKTRAALANKESKETSQTYTINKETPIKIQVVDQNGDKIASYECDKGKKITIPATEVKDKFFVEWESADNGVTISEDDQKKQSLTIQMPENIDKDTTVTIKAKYLSKIDQVEITDLDIPSPDQKFDDSAKVTLKGGTDNTVDAKDYDVKWVKVTKDEESVVKTEKPEYNTTYKAVIVLKPETGVCEFASKDQFNVTVNGTKIENPVIEKQNDGSYWIFTDTMKTGMSEFELAQAITIKGKTGTELNNLELPDSVLIKATDGYKIASIQEGTLKSTVYEKDTAGSYSATAEINLENTGVKAKDGKTPTVDVTIILEGKSIAKVPVLNEDSEQNAYKGTKTVKFADAENGAKIYYKVEKVTSLDQGSTVTDEEDADGYMLYDADQGIKLEKPAEKGTSVNYKVTAYTRVDDKADSAKVTFLYSVCNPYSVTIKYKDTGFGNPWGKDNTRNSDTYEYSPEEEVTIIAPEITSESFSQWQDPKGMDLTDTEKTNKSLSVGKLTEDITVTAVYNPVVHNVNLTVKKPSTGENLATHVEKCEYTIDNTYDLEKAAGVLLPIESWSPEEASGVAAANKAYTAKVSMPFKADVGGTEMIFKVSPDLNVTVKDEDGKDVSSEVQKTDSTLSVFCKFGETEKAKAISVAQPDDITVANGTSESEIKGKLSKTAAVRLSTGVTENANIDWTLGKYDSTSTSVQAVTATGTVNVPDYIDATDIAKDGKVTVTAKVYVEGAERAQAPQASLQDGVYIGDQKVTLSCATEGAKIYYTTDGSTPTTSSSEYKEGEDIELKDNTVLTAIAVKDNMQDSAASSYTYTIHNHKDENKDGKCDGIKITGKDGKEETQSCDTVFLGRSGDNSTDTVYGSVKQDDGKGTIYVQVNASDIFEKTDADNSDTSTQAEESSGEESKSDTNIQWKYSNSVYPTTNLQYEYKVKDSDGKDTGKTQTHNYIFAGWYKAETTTTTDEDGEVQTTTKMTPYDKMPQETAYAKFVDATVLGVKAQVTLNTTSKSEKTDMRFLTTVDGLNYQEVGFDINYNKGKTIHVSSNTVYKEVLASIEGVAAKKDPAKTMGNDLSSYFLAHTVTNIPQTAFTEEFNVIPYWITYDGTTVHGQQVQKKVSDAPGYE